MSYKNTQHYRHTVHRYLDAIWSVSSNKRKARTSMYQWLSTQLDIPYELCHVKWFTREQCRKAIQILRPRYIQLFGQDLPWRKKEKDMNEVPEEIEELAEHLSGSYWNYRWFKVITEDEHYYECHEVYYDKNEKPFMWTDEPVRMQFEDMEDLMETIQHLLDAALKPVLLLQGPEDNKELTETEEYIDKYQLLEKWRKK